VFIAPLVLGVLSLGALFIWQWFADRRWKGRMAATLPMVLLRNRVYLAAIISTCLMGFPYFVSIYAFPTRFQVVNGKNPLQAGLMLLPMLAATAIGGGVAGAINGKKNVIAETLAVSTGFMILGAALETTAGSGEQVEAKVLGFLVFIGLGFGLSATCTTMIGMLESPVREHGMSTSLLLPRSFNVLTTIYQQLPRASSPRFEFWEAALASRHHRPYWASRCAPKQVASWPPIN